MNGIGLTVCSKSWRTRFPPAESPENMMSLGERPEEEERR